MIRDLSETLRAMLDDPGVTAPFPELAAAQILFDRPGDTFNPAQTTVDLFLYDIRENLELRSNEPEITRTNGQVTIRRPPLRVDCAYLVTAWPVGGTEPVLQEHRLLSQVLVALARFPTIPAPFLRGTLVGQEPPLPLLAARADELHNAAEFWTALGNTLRPSLTVKATLAMNVMAPVTAPMVRTRDVTLEQQDLPATRERFFRIGGRVTDAGGGPVALATVTLLEVGLVATTNVEGRYAVGTVRPGAYTLRAQAGAAVRDVAIAVPPAPGGTYDVQLPP